MLISYIMGLGLFFCYLLFLSPLISVGIHFLRDYDDPRPLGLMMACIFGLGLLCFYFPLIMGILLIVIEIFELLRGV